MALEPWKWGLVPVLLVAVYTDWRWHKIYNWLTLPSLGLGLLAAVAGGGLERGPAGALASGLSSLEGFALLTGVFLALTLLGGMKAGDLKLMAAVGAWLGWPLSLTALLYVGVAGGVFSLAWAAAHGALGRTLAQVRNFFLALQGGINPTPFVQTSAAPMFPYGISIAIGTLAAMLGPPILALSSRG